MSESLYKSISLIHATLLVVLFPFQEHDYSGKIITGIALRGLLIAYFSAQLSLISYHTSMLIRSHLALVEFW